VFDLLSSDPVDGKVLYCALLVWEIHVTFVAAGLQTPEPDSLSDVESTKSAHPAKDRSLPVKGMYPLLDLITEQGSSGLGNPIFSCQSCLRSQHLS
jgi:hypothetical protein